MEFLHEHHFSQFRTETDVDSFNSVTYTYRGGKEMNKKSEVGTVF